MTLCNYCRTKPAVEEHGSYCSLRCRQDHDWELARDQIRELVQEDVDLVLHLFTQRQLSDLADDRRDTLSTRRS